VSEATARALAGPSDDATRAARLRAMRLAATGLLAAMAVVYVLASLYVGKAPWLGWVRAFAEAAMVGACADWFAVTALFRRPFGLPIPHTGIIPRNKDRIGEALGDFIANNFLTAEILEGKLRQLEVARWGAGWLREPGHAAALADRLVRLIPELLQLSTPQARRQFIAAITADAAAAVPAGPLAASALRAVWSEGRSQAILDRGLDLAAGYLARNQDLVRAELAGKTFRWLPRWLDNRIADKALQVLTEVIEDLRRPDHPWRERIGQAVADFIERLDTDPELRARAEEVKRSVMSHPVLLERLADIGAALEARLNPQTPEARQAIADWLAAQLARLGAWLDERSDAREIFNAWARQASQRIIAPRRHEIGRFIASVVADWDAQGVVDKLELQVGADLQYIRINGTLVGGLVGLAIYGVSRALGLGQ